MQSARRARGRRMFQLHQRQQDYEARGLCPWRDCGRSRACAERIMRGGGSSSIQLLLMCQPPLTNGSRSGCWEDPMSHDPISVPVDLRLDNQDLRCAEDLCAVVEACDREAQRRQVPPPKTLTLGPWGHEPGCSCHGTLEVLRETSCEASEAAEAFMTTSAIWTRWPLRSICLCELRLSVPLERLGAALAAAAPSVLRLQHLSLRGTALSLLQAFAGHELELLDLSGNALTDDDFEMLLNLAGPKSALKLHGLILSCNPSITQVSLQQLLASEWASQLQLLDLSECSIGPSGALLLGNFLQMPSSVLRDLCLYRAGIGLEGLRRLVAAAAVCSSLRALDVTANAQREHHWLEALGKPLAECLAQPKALKILTLSCPEHQLKAAEIFHTLPLRVILVPNEQNNYNRPMFLGHTD
ncbi:unnamed protein product [Durusdinium trenchii]|uniref:Uncharacterized protein n=1 Tax=Durusdinium trenchii TaxID=1381693 RepID=A0ABP0IJ13_9DINO